MIMIYGDIKISSCSTWNGIIKSQPFLTGKGMKKCSENRLVQISEKYTLWKDTVLYGKFCRRREKTHGK
jgi:hypothetical protein